MNILFVVGGILGGFILILLIACAFGGAAGGMYDEVSGDAAREDYYKSREGHGSSEYHG